ncbi:hypothetical protein MKL09_29210 [Methylobacterium sp. J-048]|uniref:hypothetical protein n=1 Tax=Methylobacterium sp. J-048 TaxID=2836635 RepID=UPI001FBB2022|nr:hypothetical protein [Methylobacterium sp. J-048]MCJ2060591.1 hypothetical protein [Methylobacterium sp. J-048]
MDRLSNGPFDDLAEEAGFKGTEHCITPASTMYAVHGPLGLDRPELGYLDDLRQLLRLCQKQSVMEALVGDSDDAAATDEIVHGAEALYRHVAQLVGYRSDLRPWEDPSRDTRPFAERMANPDDIPF